LFIDLHIKTYKHPLVSLHIVNHIDWIKYLIAPNFVTIDVEKHWWDRKTKKYKTVD
jgi:hypothetical protein